MNKANSLLLALAASFVLSACGGGAGTTDLPAPNGGSGNTGNAPYTGPTARDADVLKYQQEFWSNARTTDRCGNCHNETVGQNPMFVRSDDVNMAYDHALTVVDTTTPSLSRIVEKVSEGQLGHNCWVADPNVCGSIMTTWIENWLGNTAGGGREIVLTPPAFQAPGSSKNFPDDAFGPPSFDALIYQPILELYCSDCHSSDSANAIQPYFADTDVVAAYDAARSKINLDDGDATVTLATANSRFIARLRDESHNCWSDCASNAQTMYNAINTYADLINPTVVDPALVTSGAIRLVDGTLASGGNRFEDAQVALWEFKTGAGLVAFDTSGVDPAIDLNLSGNVEWFGGWGITINDGKAQGSTTASKKLFDILQESGEFTIEAWVIPSNVTQEEARIVSYSAGTQARNFTLQQNLYDYDFQLRTSETSLNGDPALSTPAAAEVLQATLQHVVAVYSPIDGRSIYVNGQLVSQVDPVPGGTLVDWQDTFAIVLGNEASNDGLWQGTFRLAAVHRRALTQAQVQQNFDVGVGEKFFLLFDISSQLAAAPQSSYVLFEVAQYDTHAYLFDRPHFITLDGSTPEGIAIQGMRVGMNGQEADVGQTYAKMDDTLSASLFVELGQPLSTLGAVIPLEKGPDTDEFFLTFDQLNTFSFTRDPAPSLFVDGREQVLTAADLDPASHVGVRTFDEINATYAAVTGVDPNTTAVDMTFQELRQSLPAVADVNTFLSSHQVAIAQLAIQYCDALIDGPTAGTYFAGFDFNESNATAFNGTNRDLLVEPLIRNIVGNTPTGPQLASQPTYAAVYTELASFSAAGGRPDNLIDRLLNPAPDVDGNPVIPSDTRSISKGVCAATLGSAVTLVQ
jgi:hypothetical protein